MIGGKTSDPEERVCVSVSHNCRGDEFVGAKHSMTHGQSISTLQANASPLRIIIFGETHAVIATSGGVAELRPPAANSRGGGPNSREAELKHWTRRAPAARFPRGTRAQRRVAL